jgi:hypothetical protein
MALPWGSIFVSPGASRSGIINVAKMQHNSALSLQHKMAVPTKFADIAHCLYINLATRPDRRAHVERQLTTVMGLNGATAVRRFNAVCLPPKSGSGAVGCSMSHLQCLQLERGSKLPYVLIVEDDILFTDPATFAASYEAAISAANTAPWDVLLIAGNNAAPLQAEMGPHVGRVYHCQTTTGYIVRQHYYDTLIANIRDGIRMLLQDKEVRQGPNHWTQYQLRYCIDKNWFALQERDMWLLVTPLTVTQREDYSDIEGRMTNYTPAMLMLDKSGRGGPTRAQRALIAKK